MWISKKQFKELEKSMRELEMESEAHHDSLVSLYDHFVKMMDRENELQRTLSEVLDALNKIYEERRKK